MLKLRWHCSSNNSWTILPGMPSSRSNGIWIAFPLPAQHPNTQESWETLPKEIAPTHNPCGTQHTSTQPGLPTAYITNNSCFRSSKHTCISQLPCLPSNFSCKRTLQSSSTGNEHLLTLKFHTENEKKTMRYGKRAWAANPPQVVGVHQYHLLSTQVRPQVHSSEKVTWRDRGIVTAACIVTLHGQMTCCCNSTVTISSYVMPVG